MNERRGWTAWSPEEIKNLREVWASADGLKQHVHLFNGRAVTSLQKKAHSLGLPPRSSGPANRGGPNEHLVLKLLELRPMDITEVAAKLGVWERTARFRLNALHAQGKVHVASYERFSERGPAARMFALGAGVDASRPKPLPQKVRERARVKRMKREDPAKYQSLLARKRIQQGLRNGRIARRDSSVQAFFGGAGA